MQANISKRLNIIFLNDTAYVNGGAAYVAIMEANGLADRGHNVTFFTCDARSPRGEAQLDSRIRLVTTGQQEILHTSKVLAAVQGIRNQKAVTLLYQLLGEYPPGDTIVHLHSWNKALSAAILNPVVTRGFPFVCTLHEYGVACPNGAFYNYPDSSICHLRPMSGACISTNCDSRNYAHKLWRVARQYTQVHWYGMPARIQRLLVPSRFAADILTPHLPPGCRLDVIENPIEGEQMPPADITRNRDFYYFGRISPEKGISIFLEAAQQLGMRPVIVGDGPSVSLLKKLLPTADFRGWLPPAEARQAMRQARAIVFPSLWYENDPLIIKEAASLGVPVIASDASAASITVLNEQTGLHFRSGDSADLERAMRLLSQNDALATRLGRNAYERFWANPFTVSHHIHELERYYAEM